MLEHNYALYLYIKIFESSSREELKLKKTSTRTNRLVRLAVLVAVLLLMAYTPLGYLKVGALEISFLMLPVVVGAIIIGPAAGALLGGIFGFTSFLQCLGTSAFGVMLFSINPVFTFITCMIPRILAGWLPGILFKALHKHGKTKFVSFAVASTSGAVLNTIFFVSTLLLLFGSTEYVQSFGANLWAIVVALVGVNGVVEALVSAVVGTAVSKAIYHFAPQPVNHNSTPEGGMI